MTLGRNHSAPAALSFRRVRTLPAAPPWTAEPNTRVWGGVDGRKLGTAGSVETAARARAARSEQATKANATTRAVIAEIERAGKTTLAAIAQELEGRGVRTPADRDRWAPVQVSRLLAGWRPTQEWGGADPVKAPTP